MVYLLIAFRNLVQARKRTLFVSSALGLVTVLLILLLSLSKGLSETIIESATTLATGHVNVGGFHKVRPRDYDPIITGTPKLREIIGARTPGLSYLIDRHRGWARIIGSEGSLDAALYGIEPEQEDRFFGALQLARESEYREGGRDEVLGDVRQLLEPGTIMLFRKQAKRIGVTVGDVVTISAPLADGSRNVADARVVAVAKDVGFMSDWNVFVPKRTNLDLWRSPDDVSGAVMVYLEDPAQSEAVMRHLRGVLEGEGYAVMDHDPNPFMMKFGAVGAADWTGQRLDLTTWRDEVSYVTWVVDVLDGLAFLLIGILVAIIGVGIMNTMWIAVRERTGEIGTLRAVGMQQPRVLLMFVLEALLLGLFATTSGALIGAVAAVAIDAARLPLPIEAVRVFLMSDTLRLSVEPAHIVQAIVVFTSITVVSALWPATRAARMQPVTAIQHV